MSYEELLVAGEKDHRIGLYSTTCCRTTKFSGGLVLEIYNTYTIPSIFFLLEMPVVAKDSKLYLVCLVMTYLSWLSKSLASSLE